MKKITFISTLLLFTFSAFCQLNFENLSFDAALKKAKQTGQIIFLQFESAKCDYCNQVADKAFEDKTLSNQLEEAFICINIAADNPDRQKVALLFNKQADGFGSLFINSDGSLLHNFPGTSANSKTYHEHIDKALIKAGEGIKLSDLERQYSAGNRSFGLMELLIQTKNKLRLDADTLLSEYVSLLPDDSLQSKRIAIFIVGASPLLDSKPDEYLHRMYEAINKKKYPYFLPFHATFKNRIAHKSLQKAIAEKNEAYAVRVAQFARSAYPADIVKAQQAYDSKMMTYYQKTDNTSMYLKTASRFYDKYFMDISLDSIKTRDSLAKRKLLREKATYTTEKRGDSLIRKYTFKYTPLTYTYSLQLNNAAYSFYELTNDSIYLAKALQWSAKANEFAESFNTMDTHAHLLYKSGRKEEAIAWQKKAIALKKKHGLDTKDFENRLSAMK